jgi:preprotein translocase subunit SecD
MKAFLLLMTACLTTAAAASAASSGSPIFQIRLVLDAASSDSEPLTIVSKERKEVVNVQKTVLLDQTALRSAKVQDDRLGHPQIEIIFGDEGRKRFADITREKIGQRLAIVIDGQLYCAPMIRSEIPGGKAEITGSFSKQEAKDLAAKISQVIPKR